jgi:uncharacterized protein (TIRG00374 family)
VSRTLRVTASVAFSAVFLAFAVKNVDWAEAFQAIAGARYVFVLPMLPVTVWTLYIRAQRWRVFLRPVGVPSMRVLVAATNIGFMANMVLPLRVGEVVRPVLVSRRERVPLSGLLATIVLERIFDMFTILLLFGLSTLIVPVSAQVQSWGYRLTALAAIVGGLVILIRWQEQLVLGLLRRVLGFFPVRLGHAIEGFLSGFITALEVLDRPATFLLALAWSLYLWTVIGLLWALGIWAFTLPVPIVVGAMTITTVVAIAVSVPSAPGFIGALQLGCVLALAIFGVSESQAIAYSIVSHLSQFVGTVAAGLYSLWRENMSLSDVEKVSERSDAAA